MLLDDLRNIRLQNILKMISILSYSASSVFKEAASSVHFKRHYFLAGKQGLLRSIPTDLDRIGVFNDARRVTHLTHICPHPKVLPLGFSSWSDGISLRWRSFCLVSLYPSGVLMHSSVFLLLPLSGQAILFIQFFKMAVIAASTSTLSS